MGLLWAGNVLAGPAHTFDFLSESQSPLPAWVDAAQRIEDGSGHGTLVIPIHLPDDAGHLAVTLIFREQKGQTLSMSWQDSAIKVETLIAPNILEELNGPKNQRTIVLNRSLFAEGGILRINYSSLEVAPSKLTLSWVEESSVMTETDEVPALITRSGRQLSSIAEAPYESQPDKVGDDVVDATLSEETESLENGLTIALTLPAAARAARLHTSLLGIPLDASVAAYVNDAYIGDLQIEAPGLDDPGYEFENHKLSFAGWRQATLSVNGSALKTGENTITFAVKGRDASSAASYLRDARLQLIYDLSTN